MASEYSMRAKPVQTFPLNVLVTLLPFAAGYAIYGFAGALNAQLTGHIMSEFALEAAELNALTKVLLWIVMLVQLPLGVMVDRYGPRSVQGTCLCVAALGAALLTVATGRLTLALAICLIAIGIASTLVAGLKALVLSSEKGQFPLLLCGFVASGALGMFAASYPLALFLSVYNWRQLFFWVAAITAAVGFLMLLAVPHPAARGREPVAWPMSHLGLRQILSDNRFWRVVPLSAMIIGASWALQGLLASARLRSAAVLGPDYILEYTAAASFAFAVGALAAGGAAEWLRHRGSRPHAGLIAAGLLAIGGGLAIGFQWVGVTGVMGITGGLTGAATVLSYSILSSMVPIEVAGRAFGLASALHFAAAILIQNSADALWRVSSRDAASLPLVSTEATFAAIAALQVGALLWFWRPWLRWQHPSGLPDFAYAGLQRPERQLPRFAGMMAAVVAVLMMVSLAPVRQFVSAILKADIVPLRPGNAEAMPVPQRPDDRQLASETRTRAMQTQLDAQLTTINSLRGSLSASEKELAAVRPQIGDLNRQLAELKDNVARLDQRRRELEAAAAKPSPPQPVIEAAAPPVREPPPPPARAAVPEQSASVFIPAAQAPLRNADAAKSISRTLARPLECNATALNAAGPLILQFDRYQDTLELDHHDTLNQIVEALAFCPKLSLGIAGFTDSRGNAKTNRQLSMRRAELTAKYFEVHGVKKEQMTVEALADRNPIASNTTDEGRARNRRVEVTLRVQN